MAGNKWCWLASRSIRFDSGKVCDFGGRCLDSKHPNSACRVITLSWSPWFYFSSLCSLACVQGGGSWGKYDTGRYWFYMRNVRWGLVIRVTRCLISLSPANQYKAVCCFPEWEDDALLVYNRRCMNWHRETIIPAVVVRILEHKSVFNFFIYFFLCPHAMRWLYCFLLPHFTSRPSIYPSPSVLHHDYRCSLVQREAILPRFFFCVYYLEARGYTTDILLENIKFSWISVVASRCHPIDAACC